MAGGHHCVMVAIEDDNVPEPDETFEVVFTELIPDLAGCSTMGGDGSGGAGSGWMMMKTDGMLTPMVSNETVTITIIDNDMQGEWYNVCVTPTGTESYIKVLGLYRVKTCDYGR